MRSIQENIQTAVLKYGQNEVRSVRKTAFQIFNRMDRFKVVVRAEILPRDLQTPVNYYLPLTIVKIQRLKNFHR